MSAIAKPVERLIEAFSRLPGVGPKTASRFTFYLLRGSDNLSTELAEALQQLQTEVVTCQQCYNIADESPCAICSDPLRDATTVCVVEEPLDVVALERTHEYHGLYHVLHGAISPADNIFPDDLRIRELVRRLEAEPAEELILATNPNLEGEATAAYIQRQLTGKKVRITRLARGLPVGGDLEYADAMTLSRAMAERQTI